LDTNAIGTAVNGIEMVLEMIIAEKRERVELLQSRVLFTIYKVQSEKLRLVTLNRPAVRQRFAGRSRSHSTSVGHYTMKDNHHVNEKGHSSLDTFD
jgi:hypothetical protein